MRFVSVWSWVQSPLGACCAQSCAPKRDNRHCDTMDTLAERLRRRPAKPMGSPRVGSNPTGVVLPQTQERYSCVLVRAHANDSAQASLPTFFLLSEYLKQVFLLQILSQVFCPTTPRRDFTPAAAEAPAPRIPTKPLQVGFPDIKSSLDSVEWHKLLLASIEPVADCTSVEVKSKYSLWGSNPRPMAHKTIALTTELRERSIPTGDLRIGRHKRAYCSCAQLQPTHQQQQQRHEHHRIASDLRS